MRQEDIHGALLKSVAILSVVVAVMMVREVFFRPWVPDFSVFWTAIRLAFSDPDSVYDFTKITQAQAWITDPAFGPRPWAYPPSTLLLFAPFGWMPYGVAFAAFIGISLIAFTAAGMRLMGERWRLGMALALISHPVMFAAASGQISILLGALVIAAMTFSATRPVLSGVLLGAAAAFKPQLMVLAPLALIAVRDWRALASSVAAGAAIGALSFVFGVELWFQWFDALDEFTRLIQSWNYLDRAVTPTSILWRAGVHGAPQLAVSVAFIGFAAICVWRIFRRCELPEIRTAALIGGGLLCTPYAMNYELAILAPIAVLMVLRGGRDYPWPLAGAAGLMLIAYGAATPFVAMAFVIGVLVWAAFISPAPVQPRGVSPP